MIHKSLLLILILASGFSALAQTQADKMDAGTDGVVITKLERVLKELAPNDTSRTDISLRLADLYSERARLEAMDETAKNCTTCTQSRDDRSKALALYQGALKTADKDEKSRVVLQMAQLYQLQGNPEKADALYSKVVAHPDEYSKTLVGQSYFGLGELHFRKIKYAQALKEYEKALAIQETPRRAYIKYRIAWCYFHQDKLALANKTLIDSLEMKDAQQDASFKEEASRDLATFYSRGKVTPGQIETLKRYSPDNTRKENLNYLASELDRLGKKSSAVMVWAAIGNGQESGLDRIEGHIRLAELQFDVGRKDQCLIEYGAAIEGWKENPCEQNNDECVTLRQRLRKLILDWGHSEGDHVSPGLMKAYALYLSVFPDMEINYRAAVAARGTGQYPLAINYYRNAADIAAGSLKSQSAGAQGDLFRKDFEASLFGEIEVAEITKDAKLRDQAYRHYLDLNPQGPKAFQVKYQQAHLRYEAGQYAVAADDFRGLALSSEAKGDSLKVKSADLALDSLVLAHEDDKISPWAAEFSNAFPERRQEYAKIASQGTLSRVAVILNNPNASRSDYERGFVLLGSFNLKQATVAEKIAYFKDRLILAEKLQNLPEVEKSAKQLLAIRGLSASDKEFALSRREWVAELSLNFALAHELTEKMKTPELSEADRQLKLGTLAELAGRNPEKEYTRFIELTKDRNQSAVIAAKLVRRSRAPEETLKRYWSLLKINPALLSTLSLEVFAKTRDLKLANKVVGSTSLRGTPAARTLYRFVFLDGFNPVLRQVARHRLSRGSDRAIQSSLKERLHLLSQLEAETARAARSQDWFLQILTLDAFAKQNRRLALDIVGLPAPRGVNRAARRQYWDLLAQQAQQFQNKARQITEKQTEIWNQYAMSSGLLDDYQKTHGPLRRLLAQELKLMANAVPRDRRQQLISRISSREELPPLESIRAARASVKQDPFSPKNLERLKDLESRAGSDTLVAFLDARISKLRSGEGR